MMMDLSALLDLCVALKEVRGIDAFFEYSPHVQAVQIDVYANGWQRGAGPTHCFEFFVDGGKDLAWHKTTTEYAKALDCLTALYRLGAQDGCQNQGRKKRDCDNERWPSADDYEQEDEDEEVDDSDV